MFFEKHRVTHSRIEAAISGVIALAIIRIVFSAFGPEMRKEIKDRAHGKCTQCKKFVGRDSLIAAHYIHGNNKDAGNGRALCQFCEASYHLAHAFHPETIGLTKKDNLSVSYGHVHQLPPFEQDILTQRYSKKWQRILKKLGKDY